MARPDKTIVHHKRDWKRSLKFAAIELTACVTIGMALAIGFLMGGQSTFAFGALALSLAVSGFLAWYCHRVYTQRGDFECTLTRYRLRCSVPLAGMGDTFDVALDDIAEIHIDRRGEGAPHISIFTSENQYFWLTSNLGNPAQDIADRLKHMRPHIQFIET